MLRRHPTPAPISLQETCKEKWSTKLLPPGLPKGGAYSSLSAVAIGSRAARIAGKNPPTKPITNA